MGNSTVYVTPEGLKKLEDELEHLRTVKRQEVADRIHQAKELASTQNNAEYDDATDPLDFRNLARTSLQTWGYGVGVSVFSSNLSTDVP